jgi:AraC family transcriptional regulator
MKPGVFGTALGQAYRLSEFPCRLSKTNAGHVLAATELKCGYDNFGLTAALEPSNAYLIILQFRPLQRHEMWFGGKLAFSGEVKAQTACAVDLRKSPSFFYQDPFDSMQFYLPIEALREVSEDHGLTVVESLNWPEEAFISDHVTLSIAECLLRQFSTGYPNDQLLVDHALLALRAHIAIRYGGAQVKCAHRRVGLASWQQRRAQELLRSRIAEGINLRELAKECCLSESKLIRGFTANTGLSPHRWLAKKRLELTMELMRTTPMTLAQVALSAGFVTKRISLISFRGPLVLVQAIGERNSPAESRYVCSEDQRQAWPHIPRWHCLAPTSTCFSR